MILRPDQVRLMALGLPTTPCNKKSSNSSSTSASSSNYDQRMVVDGGSIGINGSGNAISMTDGGAVRDALDFAGTANALSLAVASTTTDRALDSADMAMRLVTTSTENAYKSTADAMGFAKDGLKLNLEQSRINADGLLSGMGKLIDFARATTDTAKAVNETATQNVAQAYQNVQEIGTGQKFLVAGGLVLAGIVAVSKMKG